MTDREDEIAMDSEDDARLDELVTAEELQEYLDNEFIQD